MSVFLFFPLLSLSRSLARSLARTRSRSRKNKTANSKHRTNRLVALSTLLLLQNLLAGFDLLEAVHGLLEVGLGGSGLLRGGGLLVGGGLHGQLLGFLARDGGFARLIGVLLGFGVDL